MQFPDEKPTDWTTQQTLDLRGGDSEALLDLIGRVQALDLAVSGLDWQVSADRAERLARMP